MAFLQNRLSARQVAWEFGGSVRVFKVPELRVMAEQEMRQYITADGSYEIDYLGVWLSFRVSTEYFKEQVSGTATDRVDILNALTGSGTVNFYPDYQGQNTISYAVKSEDNRVQLLRTRRGLFKPEQTINMRAVSRLSDYPDWLRYK